MKKKVINSLMIICLLIAFGCGGYLVYYYYTSAKSEDAIGKLADMIVTEEDNTQKVPVMINVNGTMVQKKYEKLYKENPDFIGWIRIADTNIDYLQGYYFSQPLASSDFLAYMENFKFYNRIG